MVILRAPYSQNLEHSIALADKEISRFLLYVRVVVYVVCMLYVLHTCSTLRNKTGRYVCIQNCLLRSVDYVGFLRTYVRTRNRSDAADEVRLLFGHLFGLKKIITVL